LSLLGSLDEATTYINKLKERVDELHQRRSSAQAEARLRGGAGSRVSMLMNCGTGSELESVKAGKASVAPVVEVRHHIDSSMEVLLICSTERPIKLHEVITILEEEGAEVVNANHSVAGHKIFYTIHSRVCRNMCAQISYQTFSVESIQYCTHLYSSTHICTR
jgi:UTP:GlnB (protein PII) uridylyltransferase